MKRILIFIFLLGFIGSTFAQDCWGGPRAFCGEKDKVTGRCIQCCRYGLFRVSCWVIEKITDEVAGQNRLDVNLMSIAAENFLTALDAPNVAQSKIHMGNP